ncbi:MAG: hypothetical protein PHH75_01570 [Candidatus Omnitrophica bacterium]|nr:hypothetical protein [Candidatus Omnitrophota bacterium]MDD5573848.1 hypothetical protein [Candidatus Omnitrophota bacterium]
MNDFQKTVQKKINEIWPDAHKHISKISRETLKTLKKSEQQLLTIYGTTKKKAEELMLKAKREELYYRLGQCIAPLLTSDQLKRKSVLKVYTELREVNKKLRSKSRP